MPSRRAINQRRAAEEDELDWRIEQIMDTRLGVALERRLDVVVDGLVERMGALMEARQEVNPRHGRVPNPTADLEDDEYDSYSEGEETEYAGMDCRRDRLPTAKIDQKRWETGLRNTIPEFQGDLQSEEFLDWLATVDEDSSDDLVFVAGGDGEPEFDEEEEIVTGDEVPNLAWLKKGDEEELDYIIRYGWKELFPDENDEARKSHQIHYDEAAIDRLVDRDHARPEETKVDDDEDESFLKAFKEANFENIDEVEAAAEEEAQKAAEESKSTPANTNRTSYWEELLKEDTKSIKLRSLML
ncbi:hypothetical protein CDL15_Pgr008160 [Punica granatum]|uniref:DUF1087 domain-containing protein n=1 Tax=Punica granatum TaxID=22663 RepID=A0A218VSU1_PUNGR|nr:hypothetical protein CDL15_Pgr008160 [Punica granatum]